MELLFYAIAFYGLLFVTRYLLIFLYLRKLTIQYPQYEIQPKNTVPAYLKPLFDQQFTELSQLGFKYCSDLLATPMVKLDFPKDWEILLYHPSLKTYATVGIKQSIEPTNLFEIKFFTFFQDRSLLLTLNGTSYGVLGDIPNTVLEDPYTAETKIQWQTHENRLQQLATAKTPLELAPTAFLNALQQHLKVYIDHQVKAGMFSQNQWYEPTGQAPAFIPPQGAGNEPEGIQGQSLFRPNPWALLKKLPNIAKGANKQAAIVKQRKQLATTNPSLQVEIPIELEVRQFQRMEQLQRGSGKSKLSLWMLCISLVVFVAAYTPFLSSERLAIFVGALLLHEGGHILAMKLCGYRDTSMLFLPFLGALATARKDDATLTQKFWVSFAGPIPGLLLGIGLAIFTQGGNYPEWVSEASWMLIGLNLFNLLPIYPLDGGQIADLLLFSRLPFLGVLFKSVGVVLLLLLGLGSPMLLGFAALIALTIPISFRSDRLNSRLRREFSQLEPHDPESLLLLIFAKLKQSGYGTLSFSKKYSLTKTLVQRRSEARTKWPTQVCWSLLYSLSLIGGFVAALEALIPGWHSNIPMVFEHPTARAKQEIEKATTAINANPKDVNAYLRRAQMQRVLKNYNAMLADTNRVIQLDPNTSRAYFLRSIARRSLGDQRGAAADAEKGAALSQAQLLEDTNHRLRFHPNDGDAYLTRAQILSSRKDYRGAIADCNQALRINPQSAEAYLERGNVWMQLKNYKRAIADLDQAILLDSNFVEAYELRAEIRRQLGDEPGAIADERKIEELYRE